MYSLLAFLFERFNLTLKNHISHPHCEALKRAAEQGQSSMSQDESIFVYNLDVLHEQFVGLVIQRGLPFNHFDDEQTTRVFQKHLPPKYNHWGGGSSSKASHRNQVTSLLRRLKQHKNKKARSDPLLSFEYERYIHSDFVTHLQTKEFETFNDLGFWKAKETMFLVLSRIAMDILSVQATLVASEFVFSTSGRGLSIQRTRLTLASLEMCMCFKDHLDAQECKQDKSTFETPVDFEEEILDAEVQANEVIPLSDEEIALDAASSEGSMSRPDSGGEEADAEVNYGYDVNHNDYKIPTCYLEETITMNTLTKKQKRKRTNGSKILAETHAKWNKINKDAKAKTRKPPAKGSTKGSMKGKGGPENIQGVLAYDEVARPIYSLVTRINLPNYCPNASLTALSCDSTVACSQSESNEVRESKTAQNNVCEASKSEVDITGISNDDMLDIDEFLGVMGEYECSQAQGLKTTQNKGQYDAWFENNVNGFDFDFLDTEFEDYNFTLEELGISLDPAKPVM
nr:DREB2 transcription factor [Tanacetum cinerariifolium]